MYGLILILILVIMGGAIAYIGDRIGMKIGKKRLTFLGLRPKHTSIIITIVTGVLIAAFTLALLATVSQDVRTALFGMKELKRELVRLSKATEEKSAQLALARNELDAKTLALRAEEKKYASLSQQVNEKALQLDNLQKELQSVVDERNEKAEKLASLSLEYQGVRDNLALSREEVVHLQDTKSKLDLKIGDLEKNKERLAQEVAQREELARRLSLGLELVREGNIAFRANEELGSLVVAGNSSPSNIENQLKELILSANEVALQRGSRPGKEGETAIWLSRAELGEVLDVLGKTKKPIVVRLICSANTIVGEPVVANFQLFEDKLIFKKGEVVLTDKVDGTQPENLIEQQIIGLLQRVNTTGVQKGMIPDPLKGTIGAIQALEIYNAVQQVKKINREVEIAVIALENVNVSDSLKVKLQIKK